MFQRYLLKQVKKDLKKKMVFIGGARQVGKTTLARSLMSEEASYLNWDAVEHREKILTHEIPASEFLIFDEIHKYKGWRNFLKGIYDLRKEKTRILVTGSARLDFYRHGGDSLQGRYHYLRMFPLSVAELGIKTTKDMRDLLKLGGFPEPFFSSSEIDARRWSMEYRERLIADDLLSLEQVHDVGKMELLMVRLPSLVGSPLSINALREDLQVTHKTVAHWINILEQIYALFRLAPFGAPMIRAVKKEQKHYHLDWTLIKNEALRFENMVAVHLFKWVAFREDTLGIECELRYFRDVDKREVDFIIMENGKPISFIECKWNDGDISKSLRYLKTRFPDCDAFQISAIGNKDYLSKDGIRVMPATKFLGDFI
ncbi:ATP-binding protein [bacterium]|nr:ATP-binding protein [bacterium]